MIKIIIIKIIKKKCLVIKKNQFFHVKVLLQIIQIEEKIKRKDYPEKMN